MVFAVGAPSRRAPVRSPPRRPRVSTRRGGKDFPSARRTSRRFSNAAALSRIRRRRDSSADATPPPRRRRDASSLDSPLDSYGLCTPGYRSERSNTSDDPVPVPVPVPARASRLSPENTGVANRWKTPLARARRSKSSPRLGTSPSSRSGNARCVSRRTSRRRACGPRGEMDPAMRSSSGMWWKRAPGTRVLGHGWFHGAGAGDGTTPPTSPRASFRRPKARGPGTVGSSGAPGGAASRRPERSMSTRVSES